MVPTLEDQDRSASSPANLGRELGVHSSVPGSLEPLHESILREFVVYWGTRDVTGAHRASKNRACFEAIER